MKYSKIFFVFILLLMASDCFAQGNLCAEGVSWELADMRKHTVKDLSYQLFFNIPEQKSQNVEGTVTSCFRLDSPKDVVLDFRGRKEQIHRIKINDKVTKILMQNDHIVLPASAFLSGKNKVEISFSAGNRSLNRNDDYLYTLFVPDRARTVFPCFEQPNLKAVFSLQLEVPASWQAVSNTNLVGEKMKGNRKFLTFGATKPLSTYLFSFVAGKMEKVEYREGKHFFSAYYRETDSAKIAQLPTIFKQVAYSIDWMEKYTGIPYPFQKYDFIILPGFQFGGMEHAGATLYNDRIFLNRNPTPDEELNRTELIAHETAHMWFGDMVTMNWFNDVWTKEVFANYFAALIAEPLFPKVNHSLYWLTNYTSYALAQDRTMGTTAIQQPLDNLRNAGLIYGNIIYDKAPVMMKKLAEVIGADSLQSGLREYLKKYSYSNATWDDLIQILKTKTAKNLLSFDKAWVKEKGMPVITYEVKGKNLLVKQHDPYGRKLVWPQGFSIRLSGNRYDHDYAITLSDSAMEIPVDSGEYRILPNIDGRGYGLFAMNEADRDYALAHWWDLTDDTPRLSTLMNLFENYQAGFVPDEEVCQSLVLGLEKEKNPIIAQAIVNQINVVMTNKKILHRNEIETKLFQLSRNHPVVSCRIQLLRMLMTNVISPDVVKEFYTLWEKQNNELLSESDYTNLSYQLALRMPEKYKDILNDQRTRITNPDRLRQFDFISRAVNPSESACDSLFQSLLIAENRRVEPWTSSALALLNHPLREEHAVKYIYPALEAMQDVQKTGDIFFPTNWANALLSGNRTEEAFREVIRFFKNHPDYPVLLKNKILQAAYPLYRRNTTGLP